MRRSLTVVSIGWIVGALLLTSCWQEQHHDIIPPTLPNYPVMGKVINSADGTPVEGAVVFLDTETDTTDSTGQYILNNVTGGKSYSFSVSKSFFEDYSRSVTVAYDTVEVDDIILGKIFYHVDMFNPGMWHSFSPQGLVWGGANLFSADSMGKVIYAHNLDSYMSVAHRYKLPDYPTPKGRYYIAPLGISFHHNFIATYDDRENILYELILTSGDTVIVQNKYDLPDEISSVGDLWDLTYDGFRLWSCCAGQYDNFHRLPGISTDDVIYRHNGDLSIMETYYTTELDEGILNPTGITWDGDKFWLNSRGNGRLYMLDRNLHILGYYVFDEAIFPWRPYQICWGNGYLWGCYRDSWEGINSVGGPTQYLYKFGALHP